MSMSQVVVDALNQQINNELGASYEYLAMSGWCEGQTLQGVGQVAAPAEPGRVRPRDEAATISSWRAAATSS